MAATSALISGQEAWCEVCQESVHKVFGPLGPVGALIASLFGPFSCVFAGTLGAIGGAYIDKHALDLLPLQSLKNIYVAGILGFYLIFGPLTKFPALYPFAIIGGAIHTIFALIVAIPFGVFADLISPPWK